MKSLKTIALAALLIACSVYASAQKTVVPVNEPNYSKPKLFTELPEKMPLRIANFESLLHLSIGKQATATVANNFSIEGTVISQSDDADTTVKTIVINSSNHQGATFTLTRITAKDGSVSYSGRMFNRANGDALEIVKEGDQYILRKRTLYDLINE